MFWSCWYCIYIYFIIAKSAKYHKRTIKNKKQHKKAMNSHKLENTKNLAGLVVINSEWNERLVLAEPSIMYML